MSVCLLSLASLSSVAANYKTLLEDYVQDSTSTVITGVTSATVDVAGYANGRQPSGSRSFILLGWSVSALGGPAVFSVSQTTGTYSPLAASTTGYNLPAPRGWSGSAPVISTSAAHVLLDGQNLSDTSEAVILNPIFNFTSLSAAATYYVDIDFGRSKQ